VREDVAPPSWLPQVVQCHCTAIEQARESAVFHLLYGFLQLANGKGVDRLARGMGADGEQPMKLRRAAEKELSVELPVTEFRRQRLIVRLPHGNDRLDGFAKVSIHFGLIVAMDASAHESRTSTDEAMVLLAPNDDFEIAPSEFASRLCGFLFHGR
jgi:hypothetical protein